MSSKKLVILESPYAGQVVDNIEYAKRCVHDCLKRDEAPIVSHLLFTQPGILDDNIAGERLLGMEAGLAWYRVAEASVVYIDRGISFGMKTGILRAQQHGVPIVVRSLDSNEIAQEMLDLIFQPWLD